MWPDRLRIRPVRWLARPRTPRAGSSAGRVACGQGAGQSGEQEMEDYSYSDGDSETVVNDKTPKGILGQLLNLDILPPPQSDTTTLESGDSSDYNGPE